MKLAFTICSNNFLSYALSLADSLMETNPEYQVVIGLADKRSTEIEYSKLSHTVIAMDEVDISNLSWMTANYNIVELNTAVKPYFFEYLFNKYSPEHILFFDPDICIYDSLEPLTESLKDNDILLTPHVLKPIPKSVYPWENHLLKHGIYNLGFIGLKNTENAHALLKWWQDRCAELCFADAQRGLYVDQLWGNLIPMFFQRVHIHKHPGLNVAFWNLHERELIYEDGKYTINGTRLIFFHFSAYNPNSPKLLTKENYTNLDYKNNPNIKSLLSDYKKRHKKNNHDFFLKQPFAYASVRDESLKTLAIEINRKEKVLDYLKFRFINKEKLLFFTYSLLQDYIKYNNLLYNNRNDYRHNNIDYSYHSRKVLNLPKKINQKMFSKIKLLGLSIKTFLR